MGHYHPSMSSPSQPRILKLGNLTGGLGIREQLITLTIIIVSSLAAFAAKPGLGDVAGALIFVLGIILAGALSGLMAALVAALVAFLLYNFYFAEPVLTLQLTTESDIAPLVAFNLCAIVAGVLAGRLKDRAEAARRSNRQLASLLDASEALQSAVRLQDIATKMTSNAPTWFGMDLRIFRMRVGTLVPLDLSDDGGHWQELAGQCLRGGQVALCEGGLFARRLDGSEGVVGVMVADTGSQGRSEPGFMAALANLIALALERAALSEMIADARATARTEELKSALLSSVSHDFRTPLTAISASASSLIDYREQLDRETSMRLLRGIVDECDRLNRYTANLLEMSRLEAGEIPRQLQILGVSEVLAAVVQRVRTRAGARRIKRVLTGEDLLVNADAALFELVLVNVLDNAILYSGDGSRILVESEEEDGFCRITIADEGEGIPEADLDRVFYRFYRVDRAEPSPRGSGLGLAIAKGFVEALGGTITAQTPGIEERGTRIIIRLPRTQGDLSS
jgi:two-component system sensor histidine kinase KdpD